MSDIFDVLSDDTRRAILQLLLSRSTAARPEVSVSQIVAETGLSQPAVSKQLKVLREVGLVSVREDGQHRLYRLDSTPLHEVNDWIGSFIQRPRMTAGATPPSQPNATLLPFVRDLARNLGAAAADLAGKAPWR